MYFLSFQIVFSSASFTNFLHVLLFAFLIFALYSLSLFFHTFWCSSFPVLLNLFLALFVSLRAFVNSSVHHLLLKGDILLRGVVHSIAFASAAVMSSANRSTIAGDAGSLVIGGRDSIILALRRSQFVLSKLYIGTCSILSSFISSVVIIAKWSEPWSWLWATLHLSTFSSICAFPHTRSMVVLFRGNVIVPAGSMRFSPFVAIRSMRSSASWSCVS